MNENNLQVKSPWHSLFTLLLITFLCSLTVQFLALLLAVLSSNQTRLDFLDGTFNVLAQSPFIRYLIIVSGTFGTFYLPAVLLQQREPFQRYFPSENNQSVLFCILSVLGLFAFGPIMELIGEWNTHLTLPASLKGLEEWMREQEEAASLVVRHIAMVDNVGYLILNVIVLAVLPAIAEEYYFRGVLMNILQRMVKNQHAAIWLTGIIFSAIHVQFFGFFPRMILGVFFGYMLVWSKNIWVPILAHFVNNATVTVLAYYYTTQGKSFEELQSFTAYPIFVYLGSAMLTMLLAVFFYKKSKANLNNGERVD